MNKIKLRQQLQQFFLEDIGELDITSEYMFPSHEIANGSFLVKEDGVLAGANLLQEAYALFDTTITVQLHKRDGDVVYAGEQIATVQGPVMYLLSAERVLLNIMQRMSGIATLTHKAVQALNSDHTKICDTRKTMPGFRMFDKYAVRCGGGFNHRFGLYDGVMIKDNHIAYAGSITEAVKMLRSQLGHMIKIEVETESKEQVEEAVVAGADVIMFDNCTPEEVSQYVQLVPKEIITEISGGITLDNIGLYRHTKVDYISLGMLTHSVRALDISFHLEGRIE